MWRSAWKPKTHPKHGIPPPRVTTTLPDGSRVVIFARPFRTVRPDTLQKPLRHGPGNWRAQGVDLLSNSPDPNLIKRLWDVPERVQSMEALLWGGWLVYWLGHLSNLMPFFPLFFETILIQLIDRAPRTIFEGTEVAIPGGASLIVLVPQSLSMLWTFKTWQPILQESYFFDSHSQLLKSDAFGLKVGSAVIPQSLLFDKSGRKLKKTSFLQIGPFWYMSALVWQVGCGDSKNSFLSGQKVYHPSCTSSHTPVTHPDGLSTFKKSCLARG